MFNYISKVEFLPETNDQNKEYNEKASKEIQIAQSQFDKIDTKGKMPDVIVHGRVEKYGIVVGLNFELANQLDTELVRRFDAALFGK